MKLSNMREVRDIRGHTPMDRVRNTATTMAIVDVSYFLRGTISKQIIKDGVWYFADTGEFTPGVQVENLYRAYQAKKIWVENDSKT